MAIVALGMSGVAASPAEASEGGASFYLLGSGGPDAAVLPPAEGVFIDNTIYYYKGDAQADKQFLVGGNLVAGLEAEIVANFTSLLWVPSTDVLGGTLGLGAAFAVGHPRLNVDVVLNRPGTGPVAISAQDKDLLIGDPVLTGVLGWKTGNNLYFAASATANVPIGQYKEGELANLSFHRWILDTSLAVSWHDAKAGWDISGKAGVTFNGENEYTDYKTGTEFHAEAAIERTFSPSFSAGLQAYHFEQLSGDSGAGATLGPNKGRVTAVGATAAYRFEVGKTPVSARLRVFEEFGVKRRLDGTGVMFSLSIPLSVKMPAGHSE